MCILFHIITLTLYGKLAYAMNMYTYHFKIQMHEEFLGANPLNQFILFPLQMTFNRSQITLCFYFYLGPEGTSRRQNGSVYQLETVHLL